MATYSDIARVHKAAAYAAFGGLVTGPNMNRAFVQSLGDSWAALVDHARDDVQAPLSLDPATWFGLNGFDRPSNWPEVEQEWAALAGDLSRVAFDGRDFVIYPADVWARVSWLARLIDAAGATPPQYVEDRQIAAETLVDWGSMAAALAGRAFDTAIVALKWGAVLVVGALAWYMRR